MSESGTETAQKRLGWNPFQRLEGETEARTAAKTGAIVSGYLGLSYLIQIIFVYGSGKDTFGDRGPQRLSGKNAPSEYRRKNNSYGICNKNFYPFVL